MGAWQYVNLRNFDERIICHCCMPPRGSWSSSRAYDHKVLCSTCWLPDHPCRPYMLYPESMCSKDLAGDTHARAKGKKKVSNNILLS